MQFHFRVAFAVGQLFTGFLAGGFTGGLVPPPGQSGPLSGLAQPQPFAPNSARPQQFAPNSAPRLEPNSNARP